MGTPTIRTISGTGRGDISAGIPKTAKLLNTLDPKTFPIATSRFPRREATTLTASSGNDVPKAIDKLVATLKLKSMGVAIDKLTPAQKKYLTSWEMGT